MVSLSRDLGNQMVSIGERLREERLRLNLSQTELAEFGQVTKKTQGLYEREERSPTADYLNNLIPAGVDIPYVLTGNRMVLCENVDEVFSSNGFADDLDLVTSALDELKRKYTKSNSIVAEQPAKYNADYQQAMDLVMMCLPEAIEQTEIIQEEENISLTAQEKAGSVIKILQQIMDRRLKGKTVQQVRNEIAHLSAVPSRNLTDFKQG